MDLPKWLYNILLTYVIEIRTNEIAIKFENASTKWLRSSDKEDVKNLELTVRIHLQTYKTLRTNNTRVPSIRVNGDSSPC